MVNVVRVTRDRRAPFPVPIGHTQGQLTVVSWERHYSPTTGAALGWCPKVRCTCGNEKVILRSALMRAKVTKCLECARSSAPKGRKTWSRLEERYPVGFRTGKVEVVSWQWGRTKSGNPRRLPVLKCDCGFVGTSSLSRFCRGEVTQCRNCARECTSKKLQARHGYTDIPAGLSKADRKRLINRINGSIRRCHVPTDKNYKNYGARGVYVYSPWRSNKNQYLLYLLTLDGWDNPELELDRIDNSRGYEPGNLRWATKSQNVNNRRTVSALEAELIQLKRKLKKLESKMGATYGG